MEEFMIYKKYKLFCHKSTLFSVFPKYFVDLFSSDLVQVKSENTNNNEINIQSMEHPSYEF